VIREIITMEGRPGPGTVAAASIGPCSDMWTGVGGARRKPPIVHSRKSGQFPDFLLFLTKANPFAEPGKYLFSWPAVVWPEPARPERRQAWAAWRRNYVPLLSPEWVAGEGYETDLRTDRQRINEIGDWRGDQPICLLSFE
jgi:hypothetical protein